MELRDCARPAILSSVYSILASWQGECAYPSTENHIKGKGTKWAKIFPFATLRILPVIMATPLVEGREVRSAKVKESIMSRR